MPEITIKEAVTKALDAYVGAVQKGSDPEWALVMVKGRIEDVLAEADPAEMIYGSTPERFRIDPSAVAARERRRVEEDRRIVNPPERKPNGGGGGGGAGPYDAIRESVRAAEEEGKKRGERMRTLFERGGS